MHYPDRSQSESLNQSRILFLQDREGDQCRRWFRLSRSGCSRCFCCPHYAHRCRRSVHSNDLRFLYSQERFLLKSLTELSLCFRHYSYYRNDRNCRHLPGCLRLAWRSLLQPSAQPLLPLLFAQLLPQQPAVRLPLLPVLRLLLPRLSARLLPLQLSAPPLLPQPSWQLLPRLPVQLYPVLPARKPSAGRRRLLQLRTPHNFAGRSSIPQAKRPECVS